jgi:hypothetical protein
MDGGPPIQITDADIRAFAARLKGLHGLLPPAEQEILHTLLRRAAAQDDARRSPDAEGFIWEVSFNPLTYLDVIDFGTRGT